MRQNDSDQRNNGERFRGCLGCDYHPPSLEMFYLHRRNCAFCVEKAIFDGEFVKCPKCEYASSNIIIHLKKIHNLTELEIKESNIITRSEKLKIRIQEAVKNAIQNSPAEKLRRSKLLGELNKRKDFRERSSRTAKVTSIRSDVILDRTERLRRWREQNPETFRDKCWKKMISSRKKWKKSKPEIYIISWLQEKYPDMFEWGKMIRSKEFLISGKSDRKQVDFRSKDRNIYIEIDGPFHFINLSREKVLNSSIIEEAIERTIKRDDVLEKVILEKNKTLIRIGYGCWENRSGKINEFVLQKISDIIENKLTGIFKIGDIYGESNCL